VTIENVASVVVLFNALNVTSPLEVDHKYSVAKSTGDVFEIVFEGIV